MNVFLKGARSALGLEVLEDGVEAVEDGKTGGMAVAVGLDGSAQRSLAGSDEQGGHESDRGQVRVTISDTLNNPSTQARQALQLTDGCPNV